MSGKTEEGRNEKEGGERYIAGVEYGAVIENLGDVI